MPAPFEEIADLDRLVHEPARLSILTALSACRNADFLFLQRLTGLTKGNLSAHLSKLEEAELVSIDKGYAGKVPTTQIALTRSGRAAIDRHWKRLEKLRSAALEWQPES
ncbi:MAG: ArsR family transcriptional regulator [Acidobacteria bacterium]|nr:MAG: ArsR family transcriptional regulator [Acidobacteriota bacterium]